MYQRSVVGAI